MTRWTFVFYSLMLFGGLHRCVADPPKKKTTPSKASFYHDKFEGRKTSSGDDYDKSDFTVAHRTLPFNSILLVTNTLNHRSVVVRVNDRGPFKKSRIVDLSRAAAMKIGMVPFGIVPVQVKQLDLLDRLPYADSLLETGTSWNCFAQQDSLTGLSIELWKTKDWKHAFYMASNLVLEDASLHPIVNVKEIDEAKYYSVILTGLLNKTQAAKDLQRFRNEGYIKAVILP